LSSLIIWRYLNVLKFYQQQMSQVVIFKKQSCAMMVFYPLAI